MATLCGWVQITEENRSFIGSEKAAQESFPSAQIIGITRCRGQEWLAIWGKYSELEYNWPHSSMPELLTLWDDAALLYFMGPPKYKDTYSIASREHVAKWLAKCTEYWNK